MIHKKNIKLISVPKKQYNSINKNKNLQQSRNKNLVKIRTNNYEVKLLNGRIKTNKSQIISHFGFKKS